MVYVHLADGFEEVEALTILDVLRRGGVDTRLVSVTGEMLVQGCHGVKIAADLLFEEADYGPCEMIVLPGGLPGATNLEAHEGLRKQILAFAETIEKAERDGVRSDKALAAICAAPLVFGSNGLLEGRRATIYPGMEDALKGGIPTGEHVTVDGSILTGMGPALAMEFALALVRYLQGDAVQDQVAEGLLFA